MFLGSFALKIPPKKVPSKKEGVKDQPPESRSAFLNFFKRTVSRTSSQTSVDPEQEVNNPLEMDRGSPRNLDLEGAASEEFEQSDREQYYEAPVPGTSQDAAFRALPISPAQGRYRADYNPEPPVMPRRQTIAPVQYAQTLPDLVDYKTLLDNAAKFIPTDLIPGASMIDKLRNQLMTIITIEFQQVLNQSQGLIKDAQALFEYKGMDIWIILQKYILRANADEDAQRNLILMIVLLCERGTNFEKYASKMSKEGSDLVTLLKNKYNLVSKLNKSKANELTLARVGHCFPVLVCSYMLQCKSPTVSDATMAKWAKDYPRCMKTSAFTALLPRGEYKGFTEDHKEALMIAYLCHQIEFSKIVTKKKDHKSSIAEWVELTYPYALAGIEAEYLDDKQRYEALILLDLWDRERADFTTPAIRVAAKILSKYMAAFDD